MKKQSFQNQMGEIKFRKKLYQQQVEGRCIFNDEYNSESIQKILIARMKKTYEQMILLKEIGIALSPYVEIGAERCQRSLVMENDLGATGAAIDISYDSLKSGDYYKEVFNKNKLPLRICCDAYRLPFMSDSIPFVFCYETLHHFPDPKLIVKEIYRVLSPGGHFFFDEEPYKKMLHAPLYIGAKKRSKDSLRASKVRKILDSFFSRMNCNEIEYGIIENHKIPIGVWRQSLSFFEEKNVKLQSKKQVISDLFNPKHFLKFLWAYLLGGEISGTCRKSGARIKGDFSIHDVLICPLCIEIGRELKLDQKNLSFFCEGCDNKFPQIDGIVFLFSPEKFEKLYPEYFNKNRVCIGK